MFNKCYTFQETPTHEEVLAVRESIKRGAYYNDDVVADIVKRYKIKDAGREGVDVGRTVYLARKVMKY